MVLTTPLLWSNNTDFGLLIPEVVRKLIPVVLSQEMKNKRKGGLLG